SNRNPTSPGAGPSFVGIGNRAISVALAGPAPTGSERLCLPVRSGHPGKAHVPRMSVSDGGLVGEHKPRVELYCPVCQWVSIGPPPQLWRPPSILRSRTLQRIFSFIHTTGR